MRAGPELGGTIEQRSLIVLEFIMQATNGDGTTAVVLAPIFPREAIVVGLQSRTKQGVIAELVQHLVRRGGITEEEAKVAIQNIFAREKLGSAALYSGIAFPHCSCSFTERFLGVLGIEPRGIPFDALDGDPVHSIFLILAPLDRRHELYELLGRITAIGR